NLLASDGTTSLHSHQFNVPANTALTTTMFMVHIFPPSNSINQSTITYATGQEEGSYIIAYTLKDPAGTMVHKEFSKPVQLNSLPHAISITSSSSPSSTYVTNSFLPTLT